MCHSRFIAADGVWLGDRAPDTGDGVYVVNQLADVDIDVFNPAAAHDLTVTDGNRVGILFTTLTVTDQVNVRAQLFGADAVIPDPPDPNGDIGIPPEISRLIVDSGSELAAAGVHVGPHGRLEVGGPLGIRRSPPCCAATAGPCALRH